MMKGKTSIQILLILMIILITSNVFASGIDENTVLMLHADGDDSHAAGKGYASLQSSFVWVPDHDSLEMRNHDFSYSFWFRTSTNALMVILGKRSTQGSGNAIFDGYSLTVLSDGKINANFRHTASANIDAGVTSSVSYTDGKWHHIAVNYDRDGNITLYIDGILIGATDISYASSADINTEQGLNIGRRQVTGVNPDLHYNGHVNGLAMFNRTLNYEEVKNLYDSGITGNASDINDGLVAYYPMDNDFNDQSENSNHGTAYGSVNIIPLTGHTYTANGNPELVSAGKFGGAMSFDGTGDYLTIPDSDDWYFGTGDFTIDFWMKPSVVDTDYILGQSNGGGSGGVNTDQAWHVSYATDRFQFYLSNDGTYSNYIHFRCYTNFVADNWYHIAIVRENGIIYGFKNGVLINQSSFANYVRNSARDLFIGTTQYTDYSPLYDYDGILEEVRISKGIARWTSNFTPPAAPYKPDAYTKLLLHFDGDSSARGHNITLNVICQHLLLNISSMAAIISQAVTI